MNDHDEAKVRLNGAVTNAPEEIRKLAEKLSQVHNCRVVVANERSGYHIYMPCPDCLHSHGERELADPKYAINASKYLGIGAHRHLTIDDMPGHFDPVHEQLTNDATEIRDLRAGICMRTRDSRSPHRYPVTDLLRMDSIQKRHPDIHTQASLVGGIGGADREEYWDKDPATGVLCPPGPGRVTPVTELPPGHVALEYLAHRKFPDFAGIYDHMRVSWCYKELPESREKAIFYRKMPAGWKDTPSNRIIFHAMFDGTPMTWQARYLEKQSPDGLQLYALHPYCDPMNPKWDHVATRSNVKQAWIPVAPFDETDEMGTLRWKPSKYRTAKHSNRELMGWDAALRHNQHHDIRYCVLGEGPMDGLRWRAPGLAIIGKSLSPGNAQKIASTFHLVFTGFDNDDSGRQATETITKQLYESRARAPILMSVQALTIPGGKDPGELDQEVADEILSSALRRAKRSL